MIQVTQLRKVFGDFVAVNGINFDIKAGEIFGLLGPNGAGKTTTLRLLTTVLKPTDGDITVNGHSVTNDPEKVRHHLGVLAEATGLYDRLTVKENVRYFARLRDMTDKQITARMEQIFPPLGIDEFENKRAGDLSKGMKQKTAIAIAIIHDPPVILFDEPTSGLDVMSARQVVEFIEGYKGTNKTVILSTHLMHEAEKLCDRIAIVNKGVISAIGTYEELQNQSGEKGLEDIFLKLVQEATHES
jgi:sodium transport system ATP-binding protein